MILTALGWLAALGMLALTAVSGWRGWKEKTRYPWAAAGTYGCAAMILLAIDGAMDPLLAAVLAAANAAVVVGVSWPAGRTPDGWDWRAAARFALEAARDGFDLRLRSAAPAEAGSPEAVVAEAVTARGIPSVMDDPALGLAPDPGELVSGAVPAAPPYAALAQYISGFEPEDDMSLRMFMESNAAGSVLVADAWHHFADVCLNSVGLDPAYVAGVLEAGDSAGGHGSLLAQVHKRFGVIYAAVKEWVAAHGPLPHKAREFLTDDM